MKEAVAGVREVALELEEHLGMVGHGICLEKVWGFRIGWVCFFFFTIRDSCELLL